MDKKNGQPPKETDHTTRKQSIDNLRYKRALEILLTRPLTVKEVRDEVGCSNASDLIGNLVKLGFEIISDPIKVYDRDGKLRDTVRYHLMESSRRKAQKALGG